MEDEYTLLPILTTSLIRTFPFGWENVLVELWSERVIQWVVFLLPYCLLYSSKLTVTLFCSWRFQPKEDLGIQSSRTDGNGRSQSAPLETDGGLFGGG